MVKNLPAMQGTQLWYSGRGKGIWEGYSRQTVHWRNGGVGIWWFSHLSTCDSLSLAKLLTNKKRKASFLFLGSATIIEHEGSPFCLLTLFNWGCYLLIYCIKVLSFLEFGEAKKGFWAFTVNWKFTKLLLFMAFVLQTSFPLCLNVFFFCFYLLPHSKFIFGSKNMLFYFSSENKNIFLLIKLENYVKTPCGIVPFYCTPKEQLWIIF